MLFTTCSIVDLQHGVGNTNHRDQSQMTSVSPYVHQLSEKTTTKYVLPERDDVTFGYMLLQIRLSVCLSVAFVRPTQGVKAFGNISSSLCTLVIL